MQVNASRLAIEKLKGQIDRHRTSRSLADVTRGPIKADEELEPDEKEMVLHSQVEEVAPAPESEPGNLLIHLSLAGWLDAIAWHCSLRLHL